MAGSEAIAELLLAGEFATARWTLGGRSKVGRAPHNDVPLVGDRGVSKEHALVICEKGEWKISDLGSSNGTFVNGRRVSQTVLRDGDEVTVGKTRLIFRVGSQCGAERSAGSVSEGDDLGTLLGATRIVSAPIGDAASFRPAHEIKRTDQLRRDYEKLRIAHAFHLALGDTRGPRDVCRKMLDVAFDALPADSGAVLLRNRKTGRLDLVAVKTREGSEEVRLSDTLVDRVMRSREGVLTADALGDSRFSGSESVIAQGMRSAMAVPLIGSTSSGQVRGVLFLDTRNQVGAFEEKDLLLLAAIGAQAGFALENAELTEAREQLARYLPPPLVEQAARGAIAIDQAGAQGEGTILFADIRGFTSLAERLTAPATVALLNQFFEGMVEEVFAENGVLDKFLGDGLMALFGMPVHQEDAGVDAAVRCALRMQARVGELNARRSAAGEAPLAVGIGIDTGTVVVGSMGCARRMEYTAIGDAVNLASRICSMAQGGQVLCGASTARRAAAAFELQPLVPQRLKGKENPVSVFRVLGTRGG